MRSTIYSTWAMSIAGFTRSLPVVRVSWRSFWSSRWAMARERRQWPIVLSTWAFSSSIICVTISVVVCGNSSCIPSTSHWWSIRCAFSSRSTSINSNRFSRSRPANVLLISRVNCFSPRWVFVGPIKHAWEKNYSLQRSLSSSSWCTSTSSIDERERGRSPRPSLVKNCHRFDFWRWSAGWHCVSLVFNLFSGVWWSYSVTRLFFWPSASVWLDRRMSMWPIFFLSVSMPSPCSSLSSKAWPSVFTLWSLPCISWWSWLFDWNCSSPWEKWTRCAIRLQVGRDNEVDDLASTACSGSAVLRISWAFIQHCSPSPTFHWNGLASGRAGGPSWRWVDCSHRVSRRSAIHLIPRIA